MNTTPDDGLINFLDPATTNGSLWFGSVTTPNDTISNGPTCTDTGQPWALLVSQQVLYALVCVVGLLGNTLVIYVVIRFSKMQTVTNMYIVNLAIADECFLIGIPFLIVTMYKQQWIFGNAVCKAYMISTSINQFTSSIFLFIMSADRYIAVCHPINSPRWRTPFISRLVSLAAWTASAVFVTPVVMYAKAFPAGGDASQALVSLLLIFYIFKKIPEYICTIFNRLK